jgi:hypothetical protein
VYDKITKGNVYLPGLAIKSKVKKNHVFKFIRINLRAMLSNLLSYVLNLPLIKISTNPTNNANPKEKNPPCPIQLPGMNRAGIMAKAAPRTQSRTRMDWERQISMVWTGNYLATAIGSNTMDDS